MKDREPVSSLSDDRTLRTMAMMGFSGAGILEGTASLIEGNVQAGIAGIAGGLTLGIIQSLKLQRESRRRI